MSGFKEAPGYYQSTLIPSQLQNQFPPQNSNQNTGASQICSYPNINGPVQNGIPEMSSTTYPVPPQFPPMIGGDCRQSTVFPATLPRQMATPSDPSFGQMPKFPVSVLQQLKNVPVSESMQMQYAIPQSTPSLYSSGIYQQPVQMPPMPPIPKAVHVQNAPFQTQQIGLNSMPSDFARMGMMSQPQPRDVVDLIQERNLLSIGPVDPTISLPSTVSNPDVVCDPNIFRCTLTAIPSTRDLLGKCRLPLALSLHPFRDMKNLTVINTSMIVRCRSCRNYINPYVQLSGQRYWKCNLCFRNNDLPDDFLWDPVTKSFGDPINRPEIQSTTVEFIAPNEYMLRPPQPAIYVFILDIGADAIEAGYLHAFCDQFLINLEHLPGDDRAMIAFLAVDNSVHFFQFPDDGNPPREMIVIDVDDVFIPTISGLLINIHTRKESIRNFVQSLPTIFESRHNTKNALGAALNSAKELIKDLGGRITVIQCTLPDIGPGSLKSREDPNIRAGNEVPHLGPATDFYKKMALECTQHQIAVDLFLLSSKYADLATLSEMSKYSGGCVHHFPNYHIVRFRTQVKRFERIFCRYLTRKIGFEAVLRIRCTKGITLEKFHGNFFVRSPDLLAIANVNPDSALAIQLQMEEDLPIGSTVCFQAALLYTSSKGDRRIRVHTLCLPVVNDLAIIYSRVDVKCMSSLLAKMAADRTCVGSMSALSDAREALVNAAVDAIGAFNSQSASNSAPLLAPIGPLRLLPLFILGLLKNSAFQSGRSAKLDDRSAAMSLLKTAPVKMIMLEIYPELYPLHTIDDQPDFPAPLSLTYEKIDRHGVYLLDAGSFMYIYVGQAVADVFCQQLFGVARFSQIDQDDGLPELSTGLSDRIRTFVRHLASNRPFFAPLVVIREDCSSRELFTSRLVDDKTESTYGYIEFLQHIRKEITR